MSASAADVLGALFVMVVVVLVVVALLVPVLAEEVVGRGGSARGQGVRRGDVYPSSVHAFRSSPSLT